MAMRDKNTGIAVAIAWPATFCKQAGSWYEPVMQYLGINKNNYYRAGHAAMVLIDRVNLRCQYFDFGRYHSPFQYGRVRSSGTDHDLDIKTIPVISDDGKTLENFSEILRELQLNPSCHGEGNIHASYCSIDYISAFRKAKQMQDADHLPYGPFRYQGSNCSRFVNSVIFAGKPDFFHRLRLKYFVPFTPTPLNNVNSLRNKTVMPKLLNTVPFYPLNRPDSQFLRTTLPAPHRNPAIPENAQWLSGEGAGSWFVCEYHKSRLRVTRYSPEGQIECSGIYTAAGKANDFSSHSCKITYPSNCKVITLSDAGREIRFIRFLQDDSCDCQS